MPFAAYAAARSACTQEGTSAHSASRAGKWRTAVKISSAASPKVSPQVWLDAPDAKESSTSYRRAASAELAARLTASEWDMEGTSQFRLMFAERYHAVRRGARPNYSRGRSRRISSAPAKKSNAE